MTYAEKLKDPRWQKRRLEVLQAYDFKCCDCGADDKTLHVHHMIYRKGKEPWDYEPMADLVALCEDCHDERTHTDNEIKEALTDGAYRDIARLLLHVGSSNPTHLYGGMTVPFYYALWRFLERFHGVPWRLRGELGESRINSQIACLGYLREALDALTRSAAESVDVYEAAMLKFHEGSKT
jgi:hypothetical protein